MTDVKKQTDNNGIHYSFQIVDVVPAVVGNVFARAVAHEWQVSNGVHQNGGGQMSSQNGNSTAVSNSISSSKGSKLFMIFQHRRRSQLVIDFTLLFPSLQLQRILVNTSQYFFKCQKIKRQSTHLNQPISWKLVFQMVRQAEAVHTVYFIILGNQHLHLQLYMHFYIHSCFSSFRLYQKLREYRGLPTDCHCI